MSKAVRHLRGGCCAFLSDQSGLLLLLLVAHRREISQHVHQSRIIVVKSFCSVMGHHKDRATRPFDRPRKQDAICHQGSFDAENIEELLRHREVLCVSTFQAKAAGAGIARKIASRNPEYAPAVAIQW